MFTIDQIKAAHSKVKSGADFPAYVQDIIKLGVISYTTYVNDSHTEYFGKDNYTIQSPPNPVTFIVKDESAIEKFKQALLTHQKGGTDFPTFRKESAEYGIEKWTTNTVDMTCTYFDKAGKKVLVEKIPE